MSLDAEHLVGEYLRTVTGERIVGKTPDDTTAEGWVRLTQIAATAVDGHRSDYLVLYYLQLDCYSSKAGTDGSPQKEAAVLRGTIRDALVAMPGALEGAVVTGVDIRGDSRNPDTSFEPARERYVLQAAVWMHP